MIPHHQWVYQHVCVHRSNKGSKNKIKKDKDGAGEPTSGHRWSRRGGGGDQTPTFNCYFLDEAASTRRLKDVLWDLLGCAIVFYIQPCTDCFLEASPREYLRGVGNLSYHSYDRSLILQSEGPSCSAGSVPTVTCAVNTV